MWNLHCDCDSSRHRRISRRCGSHRTQFSRRAAGFPPEYRVSAAVAPDNRCAGSGTRRKRRKWGRAVPRDPAKAARRESDWHAVLVFSTPAARPALTSPGSTNGSEDDLAIHACGPSPPYTSFSIVSSKAIRIRSLLLLGIAPETPLRVPAHLKTGFPALCARHSIHFLAFLGHGFSSVKQIYIA